MRIYYNERNVKEAEKMFQLFQSLFNANQANQMPFPPSPNMLSRGGPPGGPFFRQFPPPRQIPFQAMGRGMYPYQQMMPPAQGGFLSKLFGQAGQSGVNFPTIINNIQSVLKAAETTIPMVQQYGPMIKNIPAMIQLLKEFNELDDDDENDENDDSAASADETEEADDALDNEIFDYKEKSESYENEKGNINKVSNNEITEKKSVAKLYI